MYILLHLALELTDLLLAQLVITRRELESSQYGSLTANVSVENSGGAATLDSSNTDNNPRTESNRANDNARSSRRNADRDRPLTNRDEMPSTSRMVYQDTAEDLFSLCRNKRYSGMAEQLKRLLLFHHPRAAQGSNSGPSENPAGNSAAARSANNNGEGDNLDDSAQAEDNRQSTSESALSAEVQSIVERIRSSSSIDDDRGGEARRQSESRTIDTELQNPNESRYEAGRREYRRSYRNATVSEPTIRCNYESRNSQERDTESFPSGSNNWTGHAAQTSSGDEQSGRSQSHTPRTRWYRQYARGGTSASREHPMYACFELAQLNHPGASNSRRFSRSNRESARSLYQPHQRSRWPRQYTHDSRESSLYRYRNFNSNWNLDASGNRGFPDGNSERNVSSHRREFNVPQLQVNSVPVNDLDNSPQSPPRRQSSPPVPPTSSMPTVSPNGPCTPPPFLISTLVPDTRNNDETSNWTDQPGPSGTNVQPNNNGDRVR